MTISPTTSLTLAAVQQQGQSHSPTTKHASQPGDSIQLSSTAAAKLKGGDADGDGDGH